MRRSSPIDGTGARGGAALPRLARQQGHRISVRNLDGRDRCEAPLVVLAGNGGELKPSNRAKEQGLKMGPVSLLNLDLTSSGGRYWSRRRGRLDTAHCESQACKD